MGSSLSRGGALSGKKDKNRGKQKGAKDAHDGRVDGVDIVIITSEASTSKAGDPSADSAPRIEGVSAFTNANNVNISGGSFKVVGGNNTEYHLDVNDTQNSNLVAEILTWLTPNINYRNIQIDTFSKRTDGTGGWFLESEEFQGWFKGEGGILWCTGIPGAGKTVVASAVINFLQGHIKTGEVALAFAYCRYTEPVPIRDILLALIKQLLQDHPGLVELVRPLYEHHKQHETQPSQSALVNLLIEISKVFRIIFFVLDGLDEAPDDIQFDLILILSSMHAHFIITSRPLKNLESVLPDAVFFPIAAAEEDVRLHVLDKINRRPKLRELLELRNLMEEIISSICKKAQGMFVHASLQVEMLQGCQTVNDVRETLDALSAKMEIYNAAVMRIRRQPEKQALRGWRVLLWLLYAGESLSIEELRYAVSAHLETHRFDPDDIIDEVDLVSVCCGLVTVDQESDLVRLVHFTAKDALQPILAREHSDPHSLLASTCISRLISCQLHKSSFHEWDDLEKALKDNPFLRYAYDSWHAHTTKCDPSAPTLKKVAEFIRSCRSFPIRVKWGNVDLANSIHVAACYDFPELIDVGNLCNAPTPIHGFTPLMLSLGPYGHSYPLPTASSRSAMRLLEFPGIQINAVLESGSTALMIAAWNGCDDVVRRLLEFSELGINISDDGGRTALMHASWDLHIGVVKLLLSHQRVEINSVECNGMTALMLASEAGQKDIVELLLGHPGVEVNVADRYGMTALMQASRNGHERVVELLLCHPGVEVNAVNYDGETAFLIASRAGDRGIVELLLGHPGVEGNVVDRGKRTALMLASRGGHEPVVGLLLGRPGVEVNAVDSDAMSALMLASRQGHKGVVELLLGHPGIEVNAVDHKEGTALMLASRQGQTGVVEILLGHPGVEVNAADRDGMTALMQASEEGHEGVVELLLARPGVEVNAVNHHGRTALMIALLFAHLYPISQESVVKLLLGHPGLEVNAVDKDGRTALIYACREHGFIWEDELGLNVVHQLLQFPGVDIDAQDHRGLAALDWALKRNHQAIAECIRDRLGLPTRPDSEGCSIIDEYDSSSDEEYNPQLIDIQSNL